MADLVFKLDYAGVGELLRSAEITNALIPYAEQVKNYAGDGYSVYIGATRGNVSVRTETQEAADDNLKNNTLLKSLHR